MAANDYYNSYGQHPNTQYPPYQDPSPAYQSQAPSLHPSQFNDNRPVNSPVSPINHGASPFDTAFDDNAYPMGREPYRQDSSNSLASDSSYYGQQGRQASQPSFQDNVPLRDYPQQPPKENNSTDHVYDAPIGQDAAHGYEDGGRKPAGLGQFMTKMPKKRIPFVVYALTLAQIIVFIFEIVKNAQLTGSPIEIKPSFNPMIGPSPWVTISMGSRYVPCMHNITGVTFNSSIAWGCANTTSTTGATCTLNQLCGFGDESTIYSNDHVPNQWFRFIIPMFLHAGIIHIGFNMLLQLTLGREIEMIIGHIRFFLVYISAGIFGFVLGGNFAADGISSTGASGSLFGILALTLLDLLYTWKERSSPMKDLAFIMLDLVISFVLGLLPGLDNFSHIGGFLMGLILGICILHSPNALRARIGQDDPPYTPVKTSSSDQGVNRFIKSPVGFFKGRKPAWWAWWLIRVAALVVAFVCFVLLMKNFFKDPADRTVCSWCKYLTCIVRFCFSSVLYKILTSNRTLMDGARLVR
ncbi:rhomboid family membrane protein-like protein [Calycina marina]|uniref:Rhomboid-type serine protease n=1 Tax=Calycina marina TaxID=1763456 RepID=A0A9P8CCL4_9HELO|nr:rhomboid family membrane protein-like protein [Calycina marina]